MMFAPASAMASTARRRLSVASLAAFCAACWASYAARAAAVLVASAVTSVVVVPMATALVDHGVLWSSKNWILATVSLGTTLMRVLPRCGRGPRAGQGLRAAY